MHAAYVTWGDGAGDILIDYEHGAWTTPPGRPHPVLPAGTQAGRARSHDIMASNCGGVQRRKNGFTVTVSAHVAAPVVHAGPTREPVN